MKSGMAFRLKAEGQRWHALRTWLPDAPGNRENDYRSVRPCAISSAGGAPGDHLCRCRGDAGCWPGPAYGRIAGIVHLVAPRCVRKIGRWATRRRGSRTSACRQGADGTAPALFLSMWS